MTRAIAGASVAGLQVRSTKISLQNVMRTVRLKAQRNARKLTAAERYSAMSAIKSKHTAPERAVSKALRNVGVRYVTHDATLPGNPDFVLRRSRIALLVHGCFWHQHSGCGLARIPKSRPEYWPKKLQMNKARDRRVAAALRRLGWRVITIWECQTADSGRLERRLRLRLATS